jgi:hypothetical protein
LHRNQQECVVTSANPFGAINRSKQCFDFRSSQEPDQGALAAFVRYSEDPLDDTTLIGRFQRSKPKE